MFEDFINAFKNFKSNKTRTFLSLLGVIIGVASVIVISSMGESSTKKVEATFGTAGLDVVSVNSGFMRRRRDSVTLVFDESFREELFDNINDRLFVSGRKSQFLSGLMHPLMGFTGIKTVLG